MKVAIHQPNYLPWLGFFHKLLCSDLFVFLDNVQFPRGKTFISRTAIKSPQGLNWLTIPIKGKSELKAIQDVELAKDGWWAAKHLKGLQANYGRAEYFMQYYPGLAQVYTDTTAHLADFNIAMINCLARWLGSKAEVVRASQLGLKQVPDGLERIIAICQAVGASSYITGEGAGSLRYMDEAAFNRNGIKVIKQQFLHPAYSQLWGEFIPKLSVVDLLFNHGPDARRIILGQEN
ncbi:MAG TPA: WbqC family protein [Bacillota bacterium]|nr:WbqC family protein [Bacillota bacterium]